MDAAVFYFFNAFNLLILEKGFNLSHFQISHFQISHFLSSECLDNALLSDLLSLFSRLKQTDHQLLWDYRLHCRRDHPSSLPKVLASAPSWDWASMAHIHSLLHHWPTLPPVAALELLDSK